MYFESINESSYRPSSYTKNLFHVICSIKFVEEPVGQDMMKMVIYSSLRAISEQSIWIEDFYFRRSLDGKLHPQYDPINSAILSNYDLLEEIVLLKVFEGKSSNMNGVIDIYSRSLFFGNKIKNMANRSKDI